MDLAFSVIMPAIIGLAILALINLSPKDKDSPPSRGKKGRGRRR